MNRKVVNDNSNRNDLEGFLSERSKVCRLEHSSGGSGIIVRSFDLTNSQAYSEWLRGNPRNFIYGTQAFLCFLQRVVDGTLRHLVAEQDGNIVGALPYFRLERPSRGTVINSLPWYGTYGGCILGVQDNGPSANAVREALLNRYAEACEDPEVLASSLIVSPTEQAFLPIYRHLIKPCTQDYRIGQITTLPENGPDLEHRLEQTFKQKTRNLVRKSRKESFREVISEADWSWRFLYDTHMANMQAVGGKSKPWSHFVAMRAIIPPHMLRLSVAIDGNKPAAALLLMRFNQTIEYITPVVQVESRSRQPISFLIWQGMIEAVKKGYRYWNWGGTWHSQKSLHHFKAGFGALDYPYTYLIKASDKSVALMKTNFSELTSAFPYYYLFPFDQLA